MNENTEVRKSKLNFILSFIGAIIIILLVLYILWLNLLVRSISNELTNYKENNHPCAENSILRCIPEDKIDASLSNCKNNEIEICVNSISEYVKCNSSDVAICLKKGANSRYNDAPWENYNNGLLTCKGNETASCIDYKEWSLIKCKDDETPNCIKLE